MSKETKLVKAQAEYIEFLQQAYNNAFSVAYNHSYREPAELVQRGIRFRERIAALNSSNTEQQGVQDDFLSEIIRILSGILKDPYGCPMCDSGKLRNPNKKHWPECLFYQAEVLLSQSSPVSAGESAGVWVKASERLPNKMYEHDVFYKLDGQREDGFIHYETGHPVFSYMNGCYVDIKDLSRVEWLDESILSTPSADADYWKQGAVEFAEWLSGNNYISTSLTTQKEKYWQQVEYHRKEDTFFEGPEITTEQLYSLFWKQKYEELKG